MNAALPDDKIKELQRALQAARSQAWVASAQKSGIDVGLGRAHPTSAALVKPPVTGPLVTRDGPAGPTWLASAGQRGAALAEAAKRKALGAVGHSNASAWLESAEKRGVTFADPFFKTARSALEDQDLRQKRSASSWNPFSASTQEKGKAFYDKWHVDHAAYQAELEHAKDLDGGSDDDELGLRVFSARDERRLRQAVHLIEKAKARPELWRRHDFAIVAHGDDFAARIWRAPFVFFPASPIRLLWETLILVMLLYIGLSVPAVECFGMEMPGDPLTFAFLCHVDIVARTRQAFEVQTHVEKRVRRIWDRYMRHGLLIDLIPLLIFWPLFSFVDYDRSTPRVKESGPLWSMALVLKLADIRRWKELGAPMGIRFEKSITRALLLFCTLSGLVHFAAMGWFGAATWYDYDETTWVHSTWYEHNKFVSGSDVASERRLSHPATWESDSPNDRWSWYLISVHSAISLISSTSNEGAPRNLGERVLAITYMLFGMVLYAAMAAVAVDIESKGASCAIDTDDEVLLKIDQALQHQRIPFDLRQKLLSSVDDDRCDERLAILNELHESGSLPKDVSEEYLSQVAYNALHSCEVFAQVTDDFVQKAAVRVRRCRYRPGEMLIEEGDIGNELLILEEGRVVVTRESSELAQLTAGTCVGEACALHPNLYRVRTATVTAVASCVAWSVEADELRKIIEEYPQVHLYLLNLEKARQLHVTVGLPIRLMRHDEFQRVFDVLAYQNRKGQIAGHSMPVKFFAEVVVAINPYMPDHFAERLAASIADDEGIVHWNNASSMLTECDNDHPQIAEIAASRAAKLAAAAAEHSDQAAVDVLANDLPGGVEVWGDVIPSVSDERDARMIFHAVKDSIIGWREWLKRSWWRSKPPEGRPVQEKAVGIGGEYHIRSGQLVSGRPHAPPLADDVYEHPQMTHAGTCVEDLPGGEDVWGDTIPSRPRRGPETLSSYWRAIDQARLWAQRMTKGIWRLIQHDWLMRNTIQPMFGGAPDKSGRIGVAKPDGGVFVVFNDKLMTVTEAAEAAAREEEKPEENPYNWVEEMVNSPEQIQLSSEIDEPSPNRVGQSPALDSSQDGLLPNGLSTELHKIHEKLEEIASRQATAHDPSRPFVDMHLLSGLTHLPGLEEEAQAAVDAEEAKLNAVTVHAAEPDKDCSSENIDPSSENATPFLQWERTPPASKGSQTDCVDRHDKFLRGRAGCKFIVDGPCGCGVRRKRTEIPKDEKATQYAKTDFTFGVVVSAPEEPVEVEGETAEEAFRKAHYNKNELPDGWAAGLTNFGEFIYRGPPVSEGVMFDEVELRKKPTSFGTSTGAENTRDDKYPMQVFEALSQMQRHDAQQMMKSIGECVAIQLRMDAVHQQLNPAHLVAPAPTSAFVIQQIGEIEVVMRMVEATRKQLQESKVRLLGRAAHRCMATAMSKLDPHVFSPVGSPMISALGKENAQPAYTRDTEPIGKMQNLPGKDPRSSAAMAILSRPFKDSLGARLRGIPNPKKIPAASSWG
jgi:CRP-like cAMP-binding protein